MKRSALLVLMLIFSVSLVWGQIISQYIETDSGTTPKGIEIWNNTNGVLDFSTNNLVVEKGTNGGTPSTDYTLNSGTLAVGAVCVIGSSDLETVTVANGAVFYVKAFTFNGDDALVIKFGGTITDVFGDPGTGDPGSGWSGSSVQTYNQNIQLLTGIEIGDIDGWTDPSTRFETLNTSPSGVNGDEGFGIAPAAGGGNATPVINNIVNTPLVPTSSEAVSVSADVTDIDDNLDTVELHWGLTNAFGTTIAMSNVGDTYTTSTDIPAQADGATVFFEIEATDDEPETSTSSEQSYVVTDPTPLVADFSASSTAIYVGDTVTFTDLTSGGTTPYTYAWDFENDSTDDSAEQNPEFTYITAGTYSVKLVVTDQGRSFGTETKLDYIVVAEAPETPAVFFSEYIEGSSSNRTVEIFNGTGADIDLSSYDVIQSHNGTGWGVDGIAYVLPLTGTLANGDVYVISTDGAGAEILSVSDLALSYSDAQGHRVPYFTGDDAMGLFYLDMLIDVIGEPGVDPGTSWDVAGTTGATVNHTLVRKPTVSQGNTNWALSAGTNATNSEWIVYLVDTFDYLGAHSDNELPLTLTSFTAVQFQNDMATIMWETASESNMSHFTIYRDQMEITSIVASNTSETHVYSAQDHDLEAGQTYNYYLEAVEYDGSTDTYGPIILRVNEDVDPEDPPAADIEKSLLFGNYPNPFNPTTMIKFNVDEEETGILEIYSSRGQLLETAEFGTGTHEFTWNANNNASGMYFYKLKTESYSETKKMILLK